MNVVCQVDCSARGRAESFVGAKGWQPAWICCELATPALPEYGAQGVAFGKKAEVQASEEPGSRPQFLPNTTPQLHLVCRE